MDFSQHCLLIGCSSNSQGVPGHRVNVFSITNLWYKTPAREAKSFSLLLGRDNTCSVVGRGKGQAPICSRDLSPLAHPGTVHSSLGPSVQTCLTSLWFLERTCSHACVLRLMSGLPLPCPFGELFLSGLGVPGVKADVTCPHGWEGKECCQAPVPGSPNPFTFAL